MIVWHIAVVPVSAAVGAFAGWVLGTCLGIVPGRDFSAHGESDLRRFHSRGATFRYARIPEDAPMTPYSAGYRRTVVLLLTAAYTFNSMDRSIISILAPSIKADLRLTDMQLGLLGGTAFALLYGLGGLPIARLAERKNRVNIMTVALIAWSSLTAMCALAASFGQLLLIRAGVGVAEAGCSPSAHSLISDYVAPARRASALSIYTCGISLGYILAGALGGYVAQHAGWRMACAAVGLPALLTALIIKGAVREPPRGGADTPGDDALGRRSPPSRARTAAILDTSRISRASCGRGCVAFLLPYSAHGARAHPRGLRCIRFLLLRPRLFSPSVRARFRLGRAHQRRLGRLGRGARDSRGRCFSRISSRAGALAGTHWFRPSAGPSLCRFLCSR